MIHLLRILTNLLFRLSIAMIIINKQIIREIIWRNLNALRQT